MPKTLDNKGFLQYKYCDFSSVCEKEVLIILEEDTQ